MKNSLQTLRKTPSIKRDVILKMFDAVELSEPRQLSRLIDCQVKIEAVAV
jgi:hypothetical protein